MERPELSLAWPQGAGPGCDMHALKTTKTSGTRKSGAWRPPQPQTLCQLGRSPQAQICPSSRAPVCRHQTDIRPSGHQDEQNCPITACGTQEMPMVLLRPWVSSRHLTASKGQAVCDGETGHRQRGRDGGDLPQLFKLMSRPHKTCRLNRERT